ncbi:MAG: thioredoxin domain-containing protein, partial [Caldilineaceae bacterium]|nr:thioredoxin domain-containing protein [Caldilineaceae bacterium]
GFGRMLGALDMLLAPRREIAIIGAPEDEATQALLRTVHRRYLPNTVLAVAAPDEASDLPLLAGRTPVDGQPAAYVCENYACNLPVTTPEALAGLLGG